MKEKKFKVIHLMAILGLIVLVLIFLLIFSKIGIVEPTKIISHIEKRVKLTSEADVVSNWDLNKVNIVYDTENIPVPVPKGYVASQATGEHTVNTGFVIYEGETPVTDSNKSTAKKTRNQWVWVPVDEELSMDTSDQVMYFDKDSTLPNNIPEQTEKDLNKEIKREIEKMKQSIEHYGGFFIGRYETGLSNGEAVIVQMSTDLDLQKWYDMYRKSKALRGENNNVCTSLVSYKLWYATLDWFVASGCKTQEEIYDSESWGNHDWVSFNYTNIDGTTSYKSGSLTKIIPSGSTEYTNANNIYDMAGNVLEMALEIYGYSEGRGCLGGGHEYQADYWGVNNMGWLNGVEDDDWNGSGIGSRAILYISN